MAKNDQSSTSKRWLRGIAYFFGGVLILLIIAQVLVTFFADDYAANYLREQVNNSPDSTYTIDFDDLSLNVFSGSATIQNLRINADTAAFSDTASASKTAPGTLFNGTVGEVEVSGVNVVSGVWGDELHVGSITLTEPDISALQNPYAISEDTSGNFASIDSSIYARISDRYDALEIVEIDVRNAHGMLSQSGDTLASVGRLNLRLQNIRVDSASARSGRRFVTDDISMTAQQLMYNMPDSVNRLKLGKFSISSDEKNISADSLQLIPLYPRFEYSRQNGQRKDRISLLVPKVNISAVDFSSYVDSARFYAQFVEVSDARFEDFLNKTARGGPPKPKTLPFVAFKNLNQPIKIDSLKINNAFISYSEYVGNTSQAGTITFENLNATFKDISNYSADIQDGIITTLDARTGVMGNGQLDVQFEFPMDTESGFHKINGKLNRMAMPRFNPMLEHVVFVRIDRGMINSLEFDMTLNEDRSNGTLIMEYENLKISVIDNQSMKQKGVMENLKTFVANNFVVRENNTPETGMQAGPIRFERIEHKSIFNYWWKSLLSGIKESIK